MKISRRYRFRIQSGSNLHGDICTFLGFLYSDFGWRDLTRYTHAKWAFNNSTIDHDGNGLKVRFRSYRTDRKLLRSLRLSNTYSCKKDAEKSCYQTLKINEIFNDLNDENLINMHPKIIRFRIRRCFLLAAVWFNIKFALATSYIHAL